MHLRGPFYVWGCASMLDVGSDDLKTQLFLPLICWQRLFSENQRLSWHSAKINPPSLKVPETGRRRQASPK
jgi:hypothetical protein